MKITTFLCMSSMMLASTTFGWKPSMHAAIAEAARKDAIDGTIQIELFPTSKGQSSIKRYQVDPELVEALTKFPEFYRAGTMGPDAYPDIMTGQMVIHPDYPENTIGGTNQWLEHVWKESLKVPRGTLRLKVRAFATGYLTHGAGDMFGHTFVNTYAGGDFNTKSTNFLRHLVLEGYVAKHAPDLSSTSTSISGIERWIYSTLVDCRKGTFLADRLYKSETVERSLPYQFSQLRDELQAKVDYFDRHADDVRNLPSAPIIAYHKEWIKDIDAGLLAFVTLSHDIAQHLVLFDEDNIDEVLKSKILNDKIDAFVNNHLIGMLGAPDFVGASRTQISELWDSVLYSVISEEDVIRLKASVMDYLVGFTGMKFSEIKDYLKRPEFHFDAVMSARNSPKDRFGRAKGKAINLTQINSLMSLKSPEAKFKIDEFTPAFNTLVMSKLILLPKSSVAQLMTDLGVPTPAAELPDNLMLGYNRKFDGSSQWGINPEKMLLEQKGVFRRVFKPQDGDDFRPDPTLEAIPKTHKITVKVTRVEGLDGGIDFGSAPDFYPTIKIGSKSKSFDAIDNKTVVTPSNWSHSVTTTAESVAVRIKIFDEDGNLAGDDDLCDANSSSSLREIRFDVNLLTKIFSKGASGNIGVRTFRGDGKDNVEVKIEVTVSEV